KFEEARALAVKVHAARERCLGKDHPDTARATRFLGGLERSLGNFTRADRLYRSAGDVLARTLGDGHPDRTDCVDARLALCATRGNAAERAGDYAAARTSFLEAARISRLMYGDGYWKTIDARMAADRVEQIGKLPPARLKRLLEARKLMGRIGALKERGQIR